MKKERNLLNLLSDEKCLDASKEAFINANNHKQSAELIAKNKQYGMAVSILILSTEELVKGILLYIQYLSIDIRNISGVYLFFTDHIIRHRLATMINLMYPMLKLIMGIVFKTKEKLHNPESNIQFTNEENAIIYEDENEIKNLFKDLPAMMDWWDEANMNKNKGFYVDYSNSLETPMQVSELEYNQAFVITNIFHKQILDIVYQLEKATDEDKKEIKRNQKDYNIDEILLPIIEERKKEKGIK
jgi:AbiV family abortive infection protein